MSNHAATCPTAISTQLQFYLARAAQARADGDAATLDNVRNRCRRSEEAWNELADRAARTEKMRTQATAAAASQIPTSDLMAAEPPKT